MILIQILGIENINKCISNLENELSNPKQPLNKSGIYMQQEALRNFSEEGAVMQKGGWKPLSQITLDIKEREGYGGSPMMVREGLLRSSFEKSEPIINQDTSFIKVYNPVHYAKFHQTGYGIPQRILLRLMEGHINKIKNIFTDWICNSVIKSFSK
jgi:phage gpG-like protein